MEVIELFDDNEAEGGLVRTNSIQKIRIMSREGRKAVNELLDSNPQLQWNDIASIVKTYCNTNPNNLVTANIVKECTKLLAKTTSTDHNIMQNTNSTNKNAEMNIDIDDICIISSNTTNPIIEILRLFPNAKRDCIQTLLDKHSNNIERVVQYMLDNGYEKDTLPNNTTSSSNNHNNNSNHSNNNNNSTTTSNIDYTSNAWGTTPAYRKDALSELYRNFPFLTQNSINKYFQKEKYHFYHTLLGIEKATGIMGITFIPSKIQNILSVVEESSGEQSNSSVGNTTHSLVCNHNQNSSTSSSNNNINSSSSSNNNNSNNSNSNTTHHNTTTTNTNTVISLVDSQPEEDCFHSPNPAIKPTSTIGRKRKNPTGSTSNSEFLSKTQVNKLKLKCSKDNSGLVVKTVVLCVYTSSSGMYDEITYIPPPLDSILETEIQYIIQQRKHEQYRIDAEAAEQLNIELAAAEGSLMECGCCYSEVPFESLVQCSEGHLFCKLCLQRYCEQTVFGKLLPMFCLCSAYVLHMFCLCSAYVLPMIYLCFAYVLSMFCL